MTIYIKVFLSLSLLFSNQFCLAQKLYLSPYNFIDKQIIETVSDDLYRQGVRQTLVYQTIGTVASEDKAREAKMYSLVVWPKNATTIWARLVTDSCLYQPVSIRSSLFTLTVPERAWAVKKEEQLRFVPPFLTPFDGREIVLGTSGKYYRYFEYGQVFTYYPSPAREAFRQAIIEALRPVLAQAFRLSKSCSTYQRPNSTNYAP